MSPISINQSVFRRHRCAAFLLILFLAAPLYAAQQARITGELKQWHKITLTLDGPAFAETNQSPSPFLDCRMTVRFVHESGSPDYRVPGYFAADGRAAESSATAGNQWRAHLCPDKAGRWRYEAVILSGDGVAVRDTTHTAVELLSLNGDFHVGPTDKSGRDFRGKGRLEYVGERYLRFAGSKEYFLKAGADSPENLLAYADFDGTYSARAAGITRADEAQTSPLKTWQPHLRDWRPNDPNWHNGKGKGLIGALNYLAGKGCNGFSFLTYNAGGDGDDVWPFVSRDDKLHYDCSKLDQWQIVFDHAQTLGLHLHFKLEETENDDTRSPGITNVPTALDAGDLGIERRLYLRELIARFAYELALNWNLGEENTLCTGQQRAMARFISDTDPYPHPIVLHTFPDWQDRVYTNLLGDYSALTGISLQNGWMTAHQRVRHWIRQSRQARKPWVVAHDEQNPHYTGVPPDPDYAGFDGVARPERYSGPYTLHDIRKACLWGTLLAGGAGVEYYFGYTLPQTDLNCEDWRSRDQSWDYCRIALDFFRENKIPFWAMDCADDLVGNVAGDNSKYCFARPGEVYVIYLPEGGTAELDLAGHSGPFKVQWYNPRRHRPPQLGSVREVRGGAKVSLGRPPAEQGEDWVVLVAADVSRRPSHGSGAD